MNNTIIYLTDNSLSLEVMNKVIEIQERERREIPLISVSQKPISHGKNVCLGEIGRSWMSLYKGILAGLEACETEFVTIAEHDVLYTYEHFSKIPENNNEFWYNHNCWFMQWGGNHAELNGMFSYWPRRFALSQLKCSRELLYNSTKEVMNLLEMGLNVEKGMRWYGEPGLVSPEFMEKTKAAYESATSGRNTQLQSYLVDYVTKYKSSSFNTINPNIDIRHGSNFTGPKRGKKRCMEIPYWGTFEKITQ